MTEKLKSFYFQLLSAGIIAILVIIPLFPKLPLFNVPKTFVAIRAEDFVLAAIVLLFLPLLARRIKKLLSDNLVLAIIGFWTVGLFSTFSAIFVTWTVLPHLGLLHYLRRIEYMVPVFLVLALYPSLSKIKEYLLVLFFVSLVVIVYGLGQIYAGFPVFSTANTEFAKGIPLSLGPGARINSTFAGHYDLAAYTVLMLPIIGAFLFGLAANIKQRVNQIALFVLAAANLWLLLQTASRISFISYLTGITIVFLLLKKRLVLVLVLSISLLSLLSSDEIRIRFFNTFKYGIKTLSYSVQLPPVAAVSHISTQSATQSATPKTSGSQAEPRTASFAYEDVAPGEPTSPQQIGVFRSSRVRFDFEWPAAVRAFLRNPILGSGYSSLGVSTDNDYLRSLGEVGIFGTFAFGLIFVELVRRVRSFLKRVKELNFEKTLVIGITGATFALLVNATFIDVFEASKIAILFWTLIGILVVTIKNYETASQNN